MLPVAKIEELDAVIVYDYLPETRRTELRYAGARLFIAGEADAGTDQRP
jgi:hypothetical protein